MKVIDYVKENIQRDYGEKAEMIMARMDNCMSDMLKPHGLTREEMNSQFQHELDKKAYPFVACCNAMESSGIPASEAAEYCRRLSENMPVRLRKRSL